MTMNHKSCCGSNCVPSLSPKDDAHLRDNASVSVADLRFRHFTTTFSNVNNISAATGAWSRLALLIFCTDSVRAVSSLQ